MWKFLLIVALILISGCIKEKEKEIPIMEVYCTKMGTNENMSLDVAQTLAMAECSGEFIGDFVCNKFLGTWVINLEKYDDCNPACIIDVASQQARIDTNCTIKLK